MTDTRVRWSRTEGKDKEDAAGMHHGGSFREYFRNKNLKLQEQFESAQLHQAQQSQLFKGVSIHVNGLTVPSHQELKQMMVRATGDCVAVVHSTPHTAETADTD